MTKSWSTEHKNASVQVSLQTQQVKSPKLPKFHLSCTPDAAVNQSIDSIVNMVHAGLIADLHQHHVANKSLTFRPGQKAFLRAVMCAQEMCTYPGTTGFAFQEGALRIVIPVAPKRNSCPSHIVRQPVAVTCRVVEHPVMARCQNASCDIAWFHATNAPRKSCRGNLDRQE